VGCGTAHLLRDAARYFPDADFVGVDIAQRMLALLERQ
jgi:ubiquinone/menaquinone biosynthesis C-methylase UbiE